MNRYLNILNSTIGKKLVVALSGLSLVGFVIVHMSGNMLIYVGPEAFNAYAHKLHSNPLLPVAEIGLLVLFLTHIIFTISLWIDNRKRRNGNYATYKSKQGTATAFASRQMILSGSVVLLFLLTHVLQMRFEVLNPGPIGETEFEKTLRVLSLPVTAALYTVGTLLLGAHLMHGIQSTFRSIGFYHEKYTPLIQKAGLGLAVILALGFASLPVYANLFYSGS